MILMYHIYLMINIHILILLGQDQQLSDWFDYFVKRNNLRDEQCLIFAHREKASEKFKPRKINVQILIIHILIE